jgi:hypothetical protein
MLSPGQLFNVWAPEDSQWSQWAKPVLFAHCEDLNIQPAPVLPSLEAFPRSRETALIIDVAGPDSVLIGLALTQIGYRPVPLYNSGISPFMIINMKAVAEALISGLDILRRSGLRAAAPPAFLLNADRMDNSERSLTPGSYDNRWCVIPQDMPSAEYFKAAGIKQVLLVADKVRDDITHLLCRYQDAGLALRHMTGIGAAAVRLTVKPPRFYKSLWYRWGVFAGLRRNAAGGFGALVPNPSAGGGGFG